MPNTLTSIFVSSPATELVEAPHPNTGVYVTGTQAVAGGPWTVVHTLITKTTTPLTMVGRLKNFPAVTVSVVASGGPNAGNIFNNILATPTGTAANATSSTALNVVVSSIANQTGYRLLASNASTGPFTQIYQGTTASFPHTGLTAGQTQYYQWQYVGGGFYDDSPVSTVFSGTSTAAAASVVVPVTKYAANVGTLVAGTGHPLAFSEGSYASVQHNGTSAKLTIWTNILDNTAPNNDGNTSPVGIGVVDGGAVVLPGGLKVAAPLALGVSVVTVALPGTGTRTSEFHNGFVQNYSSSGTLYGCCVTQIEIVGTAVVAAELTVTDQATVLVWEGDSTAGSSGIQSTQNFRTSLGGQIRQARPAVTVKSQAAGGQRIVGRYDTPAARQAQLDITKAAWGATANPVLVFGPYGVNDYGFNTATGATLGGYLATYFALVKAQVPAVKILHITPLITTIETQAGRLETAAQFRAGLAAAASGLSYVYPLDGPGLSPASNLFDTVHPNDAGYAAAAVGINTALNFPVPVTTFTDTFDRADSLDVANGWTNATTAGKIVTNAFQALQGYPSAPLARATPTSSADQQIEAVLTWKGDATTGYGLMVRESGNANTCYLAFLFDKGADFQYNLYQIVGTVVTVIQNGTSSTNFGIGAMTAGQPYRMSFKAIGSAISLSVTAGLSGGTALYTVTAPANTAIPGAGRAAISAATVGARYDSVTITSL